MRHLISALFLMLLPAVPLQAAVVLHLIIVSDHSDPDLGEGFQLNTIHLKDLFTDTVAQENLKITEVCTKAGAAWKPLTADMVRKQIRSASVSAEDALVVYIACHGYFDPAVGNFFAFSDQQQGFSRESIIKEIKARKPRLGGLITDSCAQYKRMDLDEESYDRLRQIHAVTAPLWQSLFFEQQGFLDWSAAAKGEFAVYYNNYRPFLTVDRNDVVRRQTPNGFTIVDNTGTIDNVEARGGLFTEAIISVARQNMQRRLDWKQFHSLVKRETSSEYRREVPGGMIDAGGFEKEQADQTVTLTAFPDRGGRLRPDPPQPDPPGPGPLPPKPDPAVFEIAGRWQCSCGDIWDLTRNGQKVTGTESNAQESSDVSGVYDGQQFSFYYQKQNGSSGNGTMVPSASGRTMAIRIKWSNGATTSATASRIETSSSEIAGRWRCSCGQIWTLDQNGDDVTGSESSRSGPNRVIGTFDGARFVFTYDDPQKGRGRGVFELSDSGATMGGRIDWPSAAPSTPTLTRISPVRTVRKPIVPAAILTVAGRWQCSCGDIWNLRQSGQDVSGTESGANGTGVVDGRVEGNEFHFRYRRPNGQLGNGVLIPDTDGTGLTGQISWDNGRTSRPSLTPLE